MQYLLYCKASTSFYYQSIINREKDCACNAFDTGADFVKNLNKKISTRNDLCI